jgi:hypothetical protein
MKKKKFTKFILNIKIGSERVTAYTFRIGYYTVLTSPTVIRVTTVISNKKEKQIHC